MAGIRSLLLATLIALAPAAAVADDDEVNIIGPPERAVDETVSTESTTGNSTVQAVANVVIIVNRRGFTRWRRWERPWFPDEYSGRRYPF